MSKGAAMLGRAFPAPAYQALKAAFRRLTKAAGGQESAASVTRVDHQRIGRYGRAQEPMFAPVDVVADLEADVGEPHVTRMLADLQGCLLIPKPPLQGDPEWIAHLGALGKEAGEALSCLSEALESDGKITADEVRDMELRREVREAMEVLARVDQALAAVERAGEEGQPASGAASGGGL